IWRAADEGSVAWLKVYRFGELTESQWNDAVRTILLRQGAADFEGIVLDLRNNPGGFLTGSVFLASEFLEDGVVVQQQGKYQTQTFSVERNGRLIGTPLVVLVNKGSASASEIVAGALRDRLGVKLVGETTFGKGTVQDAEDLRDGAGIHITTGRWLLPSGEWISEEGIKPDVEVALEATGAAQTESDVPVEEELSEEDGRKDAQLEKAIEVLKAR
ncbi:MAG: peptidase S41, partial [Candidatus Chisholmbacteria bacterium]|nr:peptidase S41 [Candidatus Chisholmbacteria bacterium]